MISFTGVQVSYMSQFISRGGSKIFYCLPRDIFASIPVNADREILLMKFYLISDLVLNSFFPCEFLHS